VAVSSTPHEYQNRKFLLANAEIYSVYTYLVWNLENFFRNYYS